MNLDIIERPKTWEQLKGNTPIVRDLKSFLKTGNAPHMMFVGPPGNGKTSAAYLFASYHLGREVTITTIDEDADFKEINSSDLRGIETLRKIIKPFVKSMSETPDKRKIVLLQEVDSTTKDFQHALRSVMETYEFNVIFILTLNRLEGIQEPALISRCYVGFFEKLTEEVLAQHFEEIANKYGVYFESDDIPLKVADYYNGDLRHMLIDCLEPLRGYDNKDCITKEDLYKVYESKGKSVAERVAESNNHMATFFKIYKKESVNVRKFLVEYFKKLGSSAYEHADTFATVDARIRDNCDPVIQLSYLFLELQKKETKTSKPSGW